MLRMSLHGVRGADTRVDIGRPAIERIPPCHARGLHWTGYGLLNVEELQGADSRNDHYYRRVRET